MKAFPLADEYQIEKSYYFMALRKEFFYTCVHVGDGMNLYFVGTVTPLHSGSPYGHWPKI